MDNNNDSSNNDDSGKLGTESSTLQSKTSTLRLKRTRLHKTDINALVDKLLTIMLGNLQPSVEDTEPTEINDGTYFSYCYLLQDLLIYDYITDYSL